MKNKASLKVIIGFLTIAVIASAIIFGEVLPHFNFTKKQPVKELANLTNPKVKKIFCYLQDDFDSVEECLCKVGPLTEYEINIAYQTAVDLYKYNLAIKLFNMGATDCFKEGQDILWVSVNVGDFDLANSLLKPDYPIELYHINAARSLINMDQPNWAFIYHKDDIDEKGYVEYQKKAKALAEKILALYKEQNKSKRIPFPSSFNQHGKYKEIFGENSLASFQELVKVTLEDEYSFDLAKHGSQKTEILTNKNGKKIAVIKSRNELLAQAFDKDHFAGVPPVIEVYIPKKGNVILQKWVPNSLMATEYKQIHLKAYDKWPNVLEELHHIRAFDIRIGNSDRNRGNLLVKKCGETFHVIPIDHDLLMHYIPNDVNWESLYLNVPFSDITQKKIRSINLKKDEAIMRQLSYNSDEVRSMKIRSTLLKMAVEHNLSLKQVDMLFRFFYYDFLDHAKLLNASASEDEYREALSSQFEKSIQIVQQPTEIWKLIGNSFEFYI
jgi:hypothetical protein